MPEAIQPSTWQYIRSNEVAADYDTFFAPSKLFTLDSTLLDRWFETSDRLLDLGCGTGRHLVQFAGKGFDVVGIDLSEHMLSAARAKLASAGVKADLYHANMMEIDRLFPPQHFGYAICMFSTFGLVAGARNRHHLLCHTRRLLRPGGRLVLHVHNRTRNLYSWEGQRFLLSNAGRWLAGRSEWGDKYLSWYRGVEKMFVHVFSRREVENAVTHAGFRVRELVRLDAERGGALPASFFADWWANGFILLAEVPDD